MPPVPDTHVWVHDGPGRTRRVRREVAEAEGLRVDTRPPKGLGACATQRIHMSPEEKREVFLKTGKRVEYRDELRRVYKETGLRDAEKGEDSYAMFDALKECGETGKPLDKKYALESLDLFGEHAKRKPFDVRERFLQHCQRLGVSPNGSSDLLGT